MSKTAESRLTRTVLLVLAFGPMLMLSLVGCAYGELKQVLRAQVAAETSCGDVTVENSSVYAPGHKPSQYRVKGCGVDRTYDCPNASGLISYGAKVCTYVDSKSIKPAEPTPSAAPGGGEDMGDPMDAPAAEPMPADDTGANP
jgi:hypothetical protein